MQKKSDKETKNSNLASKVSTLLEGSKKYAETSVVISKRKTIKLGTKVKNDSELKKITTHDFLASLNNNVQRSSDQLQKSNSLFFQAPTGSKSLLTNNELKIALALVIISIIVVMIMKDYYASENSSILKHKPSIN